MGKGPVRFEYLRSFSPPPAFTPVKGVPEDGNDGMAPKNAHDRDRDDDQENKYFGVVLPKGVKPQFTP